MTDKEPSQKEWKRRALKAEAELESLRKIRRFENDMELNRHRRMAVMQVALNEIKSAVEFASSGDEA